MKLGCRLKFHLYNIAWTQCINRGDDLRLVYLKLRPVRRRQHQNRQTTSRKLLLIVQVLIGRHKHIEFSFCRRQKLTVVKPAPAHFIGRGYRVLCQCTTQR